MERKLRNKLKGGKFRDVPPKRSKIMSAIRWKGNHSTELKFRLGLIREGLRGWKVQPSWISGKPDFFFPAYKLVVFLDGCFWHGCPMCGHIPKTNKAFWKAKIESNKRRDLEKSRNLQSCGFVVLRFWEHELDSNIESCIEKVKRGLIILSRSNRVVLATKNH